MSLHEGLAALERYCKQDVQLTRGMMFKHRLQSLLARVTLPEWLMVHSKARFSVTQRGSEATLSFITALPCSETGLVTDQEGRLWLLKDSMDDDAIIRTALLAVETFVKHELYENFKVDGKRVFNPHRRLTS
ncbi:hypothetical protein HOR51_gp10 [Ralstonia phage phiAp1]|uniref:Uncharacterized protein n=1 Tax=Ralstonia phage phiAp1 TaxID=2783867 RepID=A0A1L7DS35_9CAUD|nr:hypothetical protein HOR51_gp10 [Ralstonia phage phiAp1]APU03151.1 hypothetical protein phiAp1_10 [Ralstonia phage phiAp1]